MTEISPSQYEYEVCEGLGECSRAAEEEKTAEAKPLVEVGGGKCTVCAKLPLRLRPLGQSLLINSREHIDIDFGLFEIVNRVELEEDYIVDPDVAIRTAENALKHVRCYRRTLNSVGLLRENQNFLGQSCRARVLAPFSRSEVVKGRLLGSGGFSSVYEVEGFLPDDVLSAGVTQNEDVTRRFLAEHAMRKRDGSNKSRYASTMFPRYAVKHLRHHLARNPEKFERAAIDLVLEGQLLQAMDHPNIIGIRGWSYEGANAYRSGKYADYFIILDRLAETAELKIEQWRYSLRKYRSRQVTLPWRRKKYAGKMQRQLVERIETALGVANAIEYMHDRRIINRDIKTANIGFDIHGDPKVFDFGLSRLLPDESQKDENDAYVMSRVGTKVYMAPEVRNKSPYNLSADVYSFGIVLWELMALATPSERMMKKRALIEAEDSNEDWLPICACWPLAIQTLIRKCVSTASSERPDISEVRKVILKVLAGVRGQKEKPATPQRRSTFRLDLSSNEQVSQSAGSKTSHTSSVFESDEL